MLKKDLYNYRFAIPIIIVYWIIMEKLFHTVCVFKALTGIPCPACGLTHATIYLLSGRFDMAMKTNPTVILWIIVIGLFFVDRYIFHFNKKIFPKYFIVVCIITIIWYFGWGI